MASSCSLFLLFMLLFINSFKLTRSLSFPLTSVPLSRSHASKPQLLSSKVRSKNRVVSSSPPFSYNYKSPFKYSMALIIYLPIGTPPQAQQMVVDTGSQLSWIQCHRKAPTNPPTTTSFDPSLSSSFSLLPCNHPICKPRIPDFTVPTTCDQKRLCHYSYFYADGILAEGNLVREKITFSASQSTPPLILGCAAESADAEGILGMNRGRLSFVSQAKVQSFSYFRYVDLLTLPESERMPNLDPLAYTVRLAGIKWREKIEHLHRGVQTGRRRIRPDDDRLRHAVDFSGGRRLR